MTRFQMARVSKGKLHTVSITIQWCEEDIDPNNGEPNKSQFKEATLRQRVTRGIGYGNKKNGFHNATSKRPSKRLLPTDRIVLNALCAYVPRGKHVTTPVRTRELTSLCEISRRQVQICLRRLAEKKIIKRLAEGSGFGNHEGYRYQISQTMFQRWIKSSDK